MPDVSRRSSKHKHKVQPQQAAPSDKAANVAPLSDADAARVEAEANSLRLLTGDYVEKVQELQERVALLLRRMSEVRGLPQTAMMPSYTSLP